VCGNRFHAHLRAVRYLTPRPASTPFADIDDNQRHMVIGIVTKPSTATV
jgi:hypothetical protein